MNRFTLALTVVCCTTVASASAGAVSGAEPTPSAATTLTQALRKLWSDHVIWTREYIVAACS